MPPATITRLADASRHLTVAGAIAALTPTILASGVVTMMAAPVAAQSIDLSNIAGGTGGFVINGQAVDDQSGRSVSSAGDVNGDGLADVIVGADTSDPVAGANAGRSYVVFGKTGTTPVNLSAVDAGVGGFVINGQGADDRSGGSVSSAGDVNGDGLADVIVGASASDPAAGSSAGRSYVVFGKTGGTDVDLSAVSAGVGGFVINGQAAFDNSGISVSSAGDVNGDGLADVILGAHTSDPAAGTSAGRTYVVFGKTGGAAVDLSAVATGTSALGFVINGQATNDFSGRSVSSAGDVNGDGLADVIVGAYASDPTAGSNAGRSYVVFGKTGGAGVDLSAVATGTSALGFVITGQALGDFSGFSVSSAGDVNGDSLTDVIVGALQSDPTAGSNAGRSYVVFGKTGGAAVDLSEVDNGTGGFVINGQATSDQSGISVSSAGDVNGDGLADVIVGANLSDPAAVAYAGRSYVVFGKTGGGAVELSAVATGTSTLGFVLNGQAINDQSGISVSSAGDVNGDGLADVIVGAHLSDPAAGSSAGRSYVVFSPSYPAVTATYRGRVVAGNPNRQGIGTHRFGDDATSFPDSRLWVDHLSGTGVSTETVILRRDDNGLGSVSTSQVANVQWDLDSNRVVLFSPFHVTLRYTDAEIAGLNEATLTVLSAPTTAGPFTALAVVTRNAARNEIGGTISDTSINAGRRVFLIGDLAAPTATISRLDQNPNSSDILDFLVIFNRPVAPSFAASDLTITTGGDVTSASQVIEIINNDPMYVVRVLALPADTNGELGITINAGSVDYLGTPLGSAVVGPNYTVRRPGIILGDVNLDQAVDVSDVTALANSIVNGTPLP